jgi:hypothetical protein
MSRIRYVEAMIQPTVTDVGFDGDLDDAANACDEAVAALFHCADTHDDGDNEENLVLKKMISLARGLNDRYAELSGAIEDHSCTAAQDSVSPFVPVGSNEDIDTLMRREGFNSADMVAIVKLSDLEMLIANQRSVA